MHYSKQFQVLVLLFAAVTVHGLRLGPQKLLLPQTGYGQPLIQLQPHARPIHGLRLQNPLINRRPIQLGGYGLVQHPKPLLKLQTIRPVRIITRINVVQLFICIHPT